MTREIKFRAKAQFNGTIGSDKMIFGNNICYQKSGDTYDVYINGQRCVPETVGQYTGLKDKNGKDIYEGDIVEFYYTKNYTQESHQGYKEINQCFIVKDIGTVVFNNGCFTLKETCIDDDFPFITPLDAIGLDDLENVREQCKCIEEDGYLDMDGNVIDDKILGLEVIGNINDNTELTKEVLG